MSSLDTSSQPSSGLYDDLIEKYRPKYGDDWLKKRVPIIIEEVSQACAVRDYSYLVNLRYPDTAAFSRAVFTRITGIALHKTQRESLQIIREFVGDEAVASYHQEAAKQHEERQVKRLEEGLRYREARTAAYGQLSMYDLIQKLIADGHNAIVEQKRGAATEWFFFKENGFGYTFRRRDEHKYIELMLARRPQEGSDSAEEHSSEKATVSEEAIHAGQE